MPPLPNVINKDIQVENSSTNIENINYEQQEQQVQKDQQEYNYADFENYILPPLDLLDPSIISTNNNINVNSSKIKSAKVIEILNNFGIKADLLDIHIGPSVTKFEIKPDSSVKIAKILNLQDNIKMELAAKDIRIEAPISGKNAVGIEIPNVESTPVKLIDLIKNIDSKYDNNKLLLILGKDLLGQPIYCELNKMPHLLIAGATGSGKSVCMNTIIMSLLLRAKPNEVKLLLIDPKKVEFALYHQIPHLIGPVISDANEASNALKVVVTMMDERYNLFSKVQARNIQVYNDLASNPDNNIKKLPYIVVIIDELADLMAIAGKDVEMSIQRITQLARASGIHLIVATQRPSTDVVTGIIKSNIPSRISFAVSSGIDSRTILDTQGAERLLGNGDMLYLPTGESSAIRLQGVYTSDNEVSRLSNYTKSMGLPYYDDAFVRLEGLNNNNTDNNIVDKEDDPIIEEVIKFIKVQQKASTSLLQRRFGIGYNRAARLIDLLEEKGIIGPVNGSKAREVYIKNDQQE